MFIFNYKKRKADFKLKYAREILAHIERRPDLSIILVAISDKHYRIKWLKEICLDLSLSVKSIVKMDKLHVKIELKKPEEKN